jgi:4'-phosphopantetheinyl transferase
MTPNFIIDWNELIPTWRNFQVEPLSNDIHVVRVNIAKNIHQISGQKKLLEESELQRLSRIVRQEDKNIFLASSVMKKILLGKYINCQPEEVRFSENKNKKPLLINQPDLHFNTSHSGDCLVFIFSNLPCGIDIEKIKWDFDFDDVMEYSYHPQEKDYVLKSANSNLSFFQIWTMKESLLKATGEGLIDNLHQLNLMEAQSHQENNRLWHIKSFLVEDDYWCSICFQNSNSEIKFFKF